MSPIPPKNSAMIAKNANGAGMCIIPVNACIVPENPNPPNHPSTFCAPCRKNTMPSTNRNNVNTPSFEVASNLFINALHSDSVHAIHADGSHTKRLGFGSPLILLSDTPLQAYLILETPIASSATGLTACSHLQKQKGARAKPDA